MILNKTNASLLNKERCLFQNNGHALRVTMSILFPNKHNVLFLDNSNVLLVTNNNGVHSKGNDVVSVSDNNSDTDLRLHRNHVLVLNNPI